MSVLIRTYFLLTGLIFANITIENNEINFQDFNISYYIDESEKLQFNEIKEKNFLSSPNKNSFSHYDTHLWLKIKITNKSEKAQRLFLHHNDSYRLKKITFYETQNNQLLNTFDINLSNPNDIQEMYGADAIYKFKLDVNNTKTIYIQATSFIYQYYSLMLFNEKHSAQYLTSNHLPIVLILSILTGLMLYHLILYFMTLFREYLYYSLYLLFNILWGSYEYGIMGKYLGWYGELYATLHFIIILSILSLGFFIKSVLQMPKLYPIENKVANFILILLTMNLGYLFIDPYEVFFIFNILMNIVAILYFGMLISLYRKKNQFISYILSAQIFLLIFGYIAFAFYQGFIGYNFWTRYSYMMGILFDTFTFAYLLSHRINLLQEENKKSKHHAKRIEALSELLENISHQWRQPLTRINSSIMRISIEMKKNKMISSKIDSKLNDIENLSVYLSKTIDDFKSLYRKDRESYLFNLKKSIESSLKIIEEEYQKNNIQVSLEVPIDIYLDSYINEFQQVLQVILNNAQDAFISNKTKNPQILIFSEKRGKNILLQISNNGGEIEKAIIHKIFDAHFSTKKQGKGIGLFMSQKILKELMNASLNCHNVAGGVCFNLEFQT
ncbi:MAG: GGDEF domain [uncultured Sulfurovum sp.]|uniref:histidine kinase n=1 Tax=uncultured Sulfurovum sp. TaxID=269237 RepID=A0A6S6U3R6_9BACT|nr:MAG: GGDEF domain [uncultured Sulfurovum sp.]